MSSMAVKRRAANYIAADAALNAMWTSANAVEEAEDAIEEAIRRAKVDRCECGDETYHPNSQCCGRSGCLNGGL